MKIDLFSDTNFGPTLEMRKAMYRAEVGNEVAGEDPTVNRLIERVCHLLGKEAGVFMPSGTMSNGVAYRVWCDRAGDRIFFDQYAHAANLVSGLPSGLVNATPINIKCTKGIFNTKQLELAIGNQKGYNIPRKRLVSIEQTTNLGGGAVWPLSILCAIYQVAKNHGMFVHIDGARLFNAVVFSKIPAREFCCYADSVLVDFSKGLGAPMGAVLCGSKDFIENAWYYKFQQGGTMHQVGILAAACIYALDNNIERLVDDHENAQLLAMSLDKHANIKINPEDVQTNIVIFQLYDTTCTAYQLVNYLIKNDIRLLALNEKKVRAIIHQGINKNDINIVSATIRYFLDKYNSSEYV
ncbi:threonine aldolase family protein [Arsenophonus sp.]|uniref:threonine aldolase family protein n=1 Tax=Arsenophonus sp. TaxID=1872640 RepID=UPI00285F147F|nr:threonine aldolase family protein [Arsenophonus sp.]MDR5617813.1 threonine aldolase family protein [Arsenophonus sp.]